MNKEEIENLKKMQKEKVEELTISLRAYNDGYDKGYQQGRADVIDECLSVVEWDGYTIDIKERIEALKEKKK